MGMSIDEAIKDIELTSEYLKMTGVFDNPANKKCKPSLDMAISTMRKYQKIQEIINNAKDLDGAVKYNWVYEQIGEVCEDGKS